MNSNSHPTKRITQQVQIKIYRNRHESDTALAEQTWKQVFLLSQLYMIGYLIANINWWNTHLVCFMLYSRFFLIKLKNQAGLRLVLLSSSPLLTLVGLVSSPLFWGRWAAWWCPRLSKGARCRPRPKSPRLTRAKGRYLSPRLRHAPPSISPSRAGQCYR